MRRGISLWVFMCFGVGLGVQESGGVVWVEE